MNNYNYNLLLLLVFIFLDIFCNFKASKSLALLALEKQKIRFTKIIYKKDRF